MFRKACLLLLALFVIPCISSAEIKTYAHTVKQPFGDSQSPDDARVAAVHKAKHEALEKAGTYLESFRIVKEGRMAKDEIFALAAGVLKAEIVGEPQPYIEGKTFGITVVAKVDVDTNILEERVKKLLQDRELLKKHQEIEKREKEPLVRIKELESEIQKLKTLSSKEQKQKKEILKNKFKKATQGLTASELNKKALDFWENRKYTDPDKALEYLNQAINLDSNYTEAYTNRGLAWYDKGNYDQAIADYNKAIELDPRYAETYYNRAVAWARKGNYDRAISDYNKAIELDPKYAAAYINRGVAWVNKGNYDWAISDYNKAIELNPKDTGAYLGRGNAWVNKGNYDRAISDYNKVIELNSKNADAYNNRAIVNYYKRKHDKAWEDVYKAQNLGYQVHPKFLKNLREASGRQR